MWIQRPRTVKRFSIALSHAILINLFINQLTYMDTLLISSSLSMIPVLYQMFGSVILCLVLGQLDFTNPSVPRSKTVAFRRFHRINMECFRSDQANCSFVKCPCNTASVLYEQYTKDLNDLLDKQASEVSRTFIKGPAKCLLDSDLLAKAVRRQFECIWRKDKSPQNQARLRKQIACCNSLVNKDKSNYYRSLVNVLFLLILKKLLLLH